MKLFLSRLGKAASALFWDAGGNFAATAAVVAPAMFGVVGLSVDYTIFLSQRSSMQEAADQAVLAAVREAAMQGWSETTANAVVQDFVSSTLADKAMTSTEYSSDVTVDKTNSSVRVSIRQDGHGYFMLGLLKKNPQIEVFSEATLAGSANICVLALNESTTGAIKQDREADITGVNCGIFSNSTSSRAIEVTRKSTLAAEQICSAGGYAGRDDHYTPLPITDCPKIPDPLGKRAAPSFGGCDHKNMVYLSSTTLNPGVYCGGLHALANVELKLNPGIYVIKDGAFVLEGNATITGENVGFYLTGIGGVVSFGTSSNISLTAPKDGPMAGILFFEDRNAPLGRTFLMASKDARTLVGTIYLPKGILAVTGKSRFAEASDWTAIIAQRIVIYNGPNLQLNADYDDSEVPVPAGIAGESTRAYLTE